MSPWATLGPKGYLSPSTTTSSWEWIIIMNNILRRSHLTDNFFSPEIHGAERRKKHIILPTSSHSLTYKNCQLWWMPDLINGGTSEGGTYFKLPRLCPYKEPSRIADLYILTTTYLIPTTYIIYYLTIIIISVTTVLTTYTITMKI